MGKAKEPSTIEKIDSWDDLPIIININTAARMMGKNRDTVKKWAQKGIFPAVKAGGSTWLITKENFKKYIEGANG